MNVAFLTCPGTHPGSPTRRADAFEHDLMVAAIRPELEARGHALVEIDWRSPVEEFAATPLVLVGSPWDYQDSEAEFLSQLDALEAAGHIVCNSAATPRATSASACFSSSGASAPTSTRFLFSRNSWLLYSRASRCTLIFSRARIRS